MGRGGSASYRPARRSLWCRRTTHPALGQTIPQAVRWGGVAERAVGGWTDLDLLAPACIFGVTHCPPTCVLPTRPPRPSMTTLTLPEAQEQLRLLPDRLDQDPDHSVAITEGGERVMVLVSAGRYEALLETAAVRGDRELMESIQKGVREIQAGEGVAWDDAKRRLGWG